MFWNKKVNFKSNEIPKTISFSATKYDRHERRGFLLKLLNCANCKRDFPLPLEREDHAKYRLVGLSTVSDVRVRIVLIFSNECLIECSYEGCNFRVSQFQDILLHMTNNHDINLKNTIRRMEALAGRSVEPQKCRICEAMFKGVSEIQVKTAFITYLHFATPQLTIWLWIARTTSRITTQISIHSSVTSVATGP